MDSRLRQHHRITIKRIAELQKELDGAIGTCRALAESAPGSDAFCAALEQLTLIDAKIRAAKELARHLNAMLPSPKVTLVPPARTRYPTPRPHRQRTLARVVQMKARPFRAIKLDR